MRVEFTEEMSGFYTPGAPAYDTGFVVGRRDWNHLAFRLTIGTDDVSKFLADPDHQMWAKGVVRCPEFYADEIEIDCKQSTFNLFTRAGRGRYLMKYRLVFTTPSGAPMTLLGYKDVGDDWGFDAWTDTTTLYARLVSGDRGRGRRRRRRARARHPAAGRTDVRAPTHHVPRYAARSWSLRVVLPGPADRRIPGSADEEAEMTAATTESTTEIIPFTAGDGMALNMHRVRGEKDPWRGPVLLVHGAGVRANIFAPGRARPSSTCWSPRATTSGWRTGGPRIDLAAERVDARPGGRLRPPGGGRGPSSTPRARDDQGRRALPGFDQLHDVGGGRLCCRRSTPSSATRCRCTRSSRGGRGSSSLRRAGVGRGHDVHEPALGSLPPRRFLRTGDGGSSAVTHHECDNTVCRMVSFTYGTGFPGLWSHENLTARRTPGSPASSPRCR